MLAHREKKNGCVVARVRWLTHTGREVSPSGLKSGGAKRLGASDGIVVDRYWGEWLLGFSPEGGTWTAGVRKPPDLGNHPGTS
jgi:hypothetical protein